MTPITESEVSTTRRSCLSVRSSGDSSIVNQTPGAGTGVGSPFGRLALKRTRSRPRDRAHTGRDRGRAHSRSAKTPSPSSPGNGTFVADFPSSTSIRTPSHRRTRMETGSSSLRSPINTPRQSAPWVRRASTSSTDPVDTQATFYNASGGAPLPHHNPDGQRRAVQRRCRAWPEEPR